MNSTVSIDTLNNRAAKAFGAHSGSKAFTNLPTETQDALMTLEAILRTVSVVVRSDAGAFAKRQALCSLGRLLTD